MTTVKSMFRFLAVLVVLSLALTGCGSTEVGPASTLTPPPTSVGRSYDFRELIALASCSTSTIVAAGQTGITGYYCGSEDRPLEIGQPISRVYSIVVYYPDLNEAEVNQVKTTLEKTTFEITVGDKVPPQIVPVFEIYLREICRAYDPREGCQYSLLIYGAIPYGEYLLSQKIQVLWRYAPGKAYEFVPGPPMGK